MYTNIYTSCTHSSGSFRGSLDARCSHYVAMIAFYLKLRICFKIIASLFLNLLLPSVKLLHSTEPASSLCSRLIATFGLSVGLLGIFALSILANRPLFAAP